MLSPSPMAREQKTSYRCLNLQSTKRRHTNCTPTGGAPAPSPCLAGITPLAQVQEATKALKKFQDLRQKGEQDDSDELLNRAKLKEGEIVAAQHAAAPPPPPPPETAAPSAAAPAPSGAAPAPSGSVASLEPAPAPAPATPPGQ